MGNTSVIWQQTAHTTYQQSPPSCSTRATHKIQKARICSKRYWRIFWKKKKKNKNKSQENGPPAQKMTRQAAGDVQWNANHTQTHPRAEWCATRILLLLGFNVLRWWTDISGLMLASILGRPSVNAVSCVWPGKFSLAPQVSVWSLDLTHKRRNGRLGVSAGGRPGQVLLHSQWTNSGQNMSTKENNSDP